MAPLEPRATQSATHPPLSRELLAVSLSMFFSAMGANAFVQYLGSYLVHIAGWPPASAASILIIAFCFMPVARLIYPHVERRIGDACCLLAGNFMFVFFLGLLVWEPQAWTIVPAGLALGMAGACVFTAGPLRILAATPPHWRSVASGIFFATNFLAWLVAVTIYGLVAERHGIGLTPYIAMAWTAIGLLLVFTLPRRRTSTAGVSLREFLGPILDGLFRRTMFFMALSAVAFGLMFSALAKHLADTFGGSRATTVLSGFYLARLPGSLLAGYMIGRWGQRRFLVTVFGLAGIALLTVSMHSDEFVVMLAAVLVLGFQQATVPVAAMALAGAQSGESNRRASYGLLFAAAELGVAGSLAVVQVAGTVTQDMRTVFLVFGLLYLAGGIVAWWPKSSTLAVS